MNEIYMVMGNRYGFGWVKIAPWFDKINRKENRLYQDSTSFK